MNVISSNKEYESGNGRPRIVIIGAGYAGLSAAFELTRGGHEVVVLEATDSVGGLAGTFDVNGQRLEKFYHHWFTNDQHVMDLVRDIGVVDRVLMRPTRTATYYANTIFRLSRPLDLLKYKLLSPVGRIRLGLLVLQTRMVRDWKQLEDRTAAEWLQTLCGKEVFEKVWKPLLIGKFGEGHAMEISAVWFWNKLRLRGGSRGKGGAEYLAYFEGGFAALAELMAKEVEAAQNEIHLETPATGLSVQEGRVTGVCTPAGVVPADIVLSTTALPIFADHVRPHVTPDYLEQLRSIDYLGNVCLVLQLSESLSQTYWLNVADPDFPFVGVIEHTNFEPSGSYGGRHIVYLSKYVETDDPLYRMEDHEFFQYAIPYLKRMFPGFDSSTVLDYNCYRAEYSQPLVKKRYSEKRPDVKTPVRGLYLATMAQIYPEDRGTNYAIGQGRAVAALIAEDLQELHSTEPTES